ncbi:MAG: hypothetical protein JRI23_09640, partial [Deltaproteobacteria bacterium]|nr:hypothetical protein [Deltaproteobacteria bacterium]MBW2531917.1 hypothetical protein [Deltaproteobacteria bacterium]
EPPGVPVGVVDVTPAPVEVVGVGLEAVSELHPARASPLTVAANTDMHQPKRPILGSW